MFKNKNSTSQENTQTKINFTDWKNFVYKLIYQHLNMHCIDLQDEDYWVYWNNNFLPEDMADIVINDIK